MWNELSSGYAAHGSYFNDVMCNLSRDQPAFLPPLWRSSTLLAVSDFTGAQRETRFATLSLVIAPIEGVAKWNVYRQEVRKRFGLNKRRLSYSKLNDRRKRAAVFDFLYFANSLGALSVTVLIDKRIESIFTPTGLLPPNETSIGGKTFNRWKPLVFERVMRAAYFVGLFVAGVSGAGQNITWVTDEDEIAANLEGLTDLTHVFAHMIGNMLPHNVGHIRVGTTGTTAGDDLAMEDLTAVADLIGGTVNDFISSYGADVPLSSIIALAPASLRKKPQSLIASLFDPRAPLRKVIFLIEPTAEKGRLRYAALKIHLEPYVVTL